jgi:hypothetical protein
MSQQLISRSPDLQQLQEEGYEVEIRDGHLLLGHIPYRTEAGEVAFGTLISVLQLAGEKTDQPTDHVTRLAGGIPYGSDGSKLSSLIVGETPETPLPNVTTACTFSQKPLGGEYYRDYHHKMTTYVAMLAEPALGIDPEATARTYPVIVDDDEESPFKYIDNASSRAGISVITEKLRGHKVAIVGLGGTGSYILDFIAKTPVKEIHLFDKDAFMQHNAFRSPGAASIEQLAEKPSKVEHFGSQYSLMKENIVRHEYFVEESNIEELREMDFVFIAADSGKAKTLMARTLEAWGIPFIDVGMGLYDCDGSLGGQVRTTTSTPEQHEHVAANNRISFTDEDGDDPYAQNIQIVELNALNAALAVIRWKKLCGFYLDDEYEHHALYVVSGNVLINEDKTEAEAGEERAEAA